MAFLDCLKSAQEQGEITGDEALRLKGHFEALLKHHSADSPVTAPFAAREALAKLLKEEGLEKKRQLALKYKAANAIWKDINAFRMARLTRDGVKIKGKETADIGEAAIHVLEHYGTAKYEDVHGAQLSLVGRAHGMMESLLYEFRRSAVGGDKFRHGQARLDNVVDEAFGDATGDDAAKGLSKVWADTVEWLRRRYNAAGGHIPFLEKWGLPQSHDAQALRNAGLQAWKTFTKGLLNVSKMRHPLTGDALLPEELDDVLNHVFRSVTQEGWATREAKMQRYGSGPLANQNAEHRFLVFNDGKAWRAYQKEFGEGDAFSSMMSYINRMARDVAAMERLGPDPGGTVEWLKQLIAKEGQKAGSGEASLLPYSGTKGMDYARGRIDKLDRMWASMRGELETPVNSKWANGFAAGRNVITSSVLGGATLASLGDAGTQALARGFSGIPATSMMGDIVKAFTPQGRRDAVEAGLILDQAMHTFNRQARYVGSMSGPQWSLYLSDRILTWSGLTAWTQAGRHAFGLAFMREAAVRADFAFNAMPTAFKATFERYGISAKDWDVMRGAGVHDSDGLRLLRPKEIAAKDEKLAERYLTMINSEMEYAVPTNSVRAKTFLVSQDQPGTLWGEITRSFAQFKSFSAVFGILNMMRYVPMIASDNGAVRARGAKYAGALLISTTVLGGLSMQLKQIAAGRDPRNMNDKKFWGAAMLQGGGLGLFGDFFFADVNRFGGGLPSTLSGPTVQHLWDIWTLTGGNAIQLAQGEDTNAGRELVDVLKANTPGGNLWYLRLGYEHLVLDQLQYLVDPKANAAFKRKQQWWKKQTGQDFWWQPGQAVPDRGPDIGAALR
jgi:hypothetical protein